MKQIIAFAIIYILLQLAQNVLDILVEWLRRLMEYHSSNLNLKLMKQEAELKKLYSEDDNEEKICTNVIGFQYPSDEKDEEELEEEKI